MAYRPVNRIVEIPELTTVPLSAAALREHLRVDADDEIVGIDDYALAAAAWIERHTQRLLSRRAVVLRLPALPVDQCPVELPGGKVHAITSVVVDSTPFVGATAVGEAPALLLPNAAWPVATGDGYPVVITYEAGYQTVPAPLLVALRMMVADMFEQRQSSVPGSISDVPFAARTLMKPYRIFPA